MPRVKGAALRQGLLELRKALGAEPFAAATRHMSREDRDALFGADDDVLVLPSSWYEAALVHRLFDAIAREVPPAARRALAYDVSVRALTVTLTGVHRALLKLAGSPQLHVRVCQMLWNTHYDHGTVTSEVVGPGESRIAYRDWTAHHPFLCDMTTASDLVFFSAMGLADVRVDQLSCIDRGAAECAHAVRWKT